VFLVQLFLKKVQPSRQMSDLARSASIKIINYVLVQLY